MCLELGVIWLVYYVFGLMAAQDMPIWLMAFLVLLVDRTVSQITTVATERRRRLAASPDER